MASFLQLLISGLATGAIYALVAVGFTLLWQTSQTINFAQGEFVMLPAFFVLAAMKFWRCRSGSRAAARNSGRGRSCSGCCSSVVVVDPMLRHGVLPLVISTIALSMLLKESGQGLLSAQAQPFPPLVPRSTSRLRRGGLDRRAWSCWRSPSSRSSRCSLFLNQHAHRPLRCRRPRRTRRVARILGVPVERMILYTFLINAALVTHRLDPDQPDLSRQVHQRRDARPRRLRRRDRRRLQPGARRHRRRPLLGVSTISRPPISRRSIAARFRC